MRLSHHYVVPHVSTGDMLRAAVKQGTAIGQKAKDQMDRGELLGDDLIMEMVAERLGESDVRARGFVLDGCPRTVAQAERLAAILAPFDLDLAIDIEIATTARCSAGWPPAGCAWTAGPTTRCPRQPLINWTCDVCGGEVIQREDDTEEAISRRLELYEIQTAPLIEWYRARGSWSGGRAPGRPTRSPAGWSR